MASMSIEENNCPQNSRSLQQHLFSLLGNQCKNSKQLSQIHARTIINGFAQKCFLLSKLFALYTTFGSVPHAQKLFDQVQNPNNRLWNQIIRVHSIGGSLRKSIMLFNDMSRRSSALPDAYTYNFVINSCSKGGLVGEGEQIHAKILRSGFNSDVFVGASLVDFYVKCSWDRGVGKAKQVFDEMHERNVVARNALLFGCFKCRDLGGARTVFQQMPKRSVVSWTTMIAGFTQNGKSREALALFRDMRTEHVEFDTVTLLAVLSACAELGDLNLGKWVHSYVVEHFTCRKRSVPDKLNNSLIHMYAGCGEIELAFTVFKEMKHRNVVSWSNMITGFAKQGFGDEALGVFHWMVSTEDNDVKPDEITFLGVLCACSHSGYVDKGRYYFRSMIEKWGVEPKVEHFGCMVDLLSRAGLLDEAHELVKSMHMKPNDVVWGALLGGCRIYKNVDLAHEVANWLTEELEPDRAADYFVLLSNVYAAANRWQDVLSIRKKMIGSEARNARGRSWIQIEGNIYEFLAGDISYPDAGRIYKVLDEVTREARLLGYISYFVDATMAICKKDQYIAEDG